MTLTYLSEGIKKRIHKVALVPVKLCNTLYYYLSDKDNVIVVNASVFQFLSKIRHFNLGDDLNVYMLQAMTGKKVFIYNQFYHPTITNYMCIGSVIDWLSDEETIVWGAGIIKSPLNGKVTGGGKIYAVRGAKTRELLQQNGIECPAIYGDPALLLPYLYHPKVEKVKGRVGFIPHFYDKNDDNLHRLLKEFGEDAYLVKIQGYSDWKQIIREIISCEYIISSSLHGLILSDAYGVPNLWVSFGDRLKGGRFKFEDYYSAVGKSAYEVKITDSIHGKDLIDKINVEKINFDPKPLLKACPFSIIHPSFNGMLE